MTSELGNGTKSPTLEDAVREGSGDLGSGQGLVEGVGRGGVPDTDPGPGPFVPRFTPIFAPIFGPPCFSPGDDMVSWGMGDRDDNWWWVDTV